MPSIRFADGNTSSWGLEGRAWSDSGKKLSMTSRAVSRRFAEDDMLLSRLDGLRATWSTTRKWNNNAGKSVLLP